ncbi:MAG: proline dehydrogenase family protein [Chitinophagales bacterium]
MERGPHLDFNDTEIAFSGKTNKELKWEYFLFRVMNNSGITKVLTTLARLTISLHLPFKWAIKRTVYEQFCGGENLEETIPVLERLNAFHIGAIIDYGVEGKESEEEFERTKNELIRIIRFSAGKKNIPFISCKVTGVTPFALLEKLNNGGPLSPEEVTGKKMLYTRMHAIASAAADSGIGLFIDAEESWIQDAVDELTFELMRTYNKTRPVVFSTPQMYRHDRLAFSKRSLEDALQHGYILGLKPVRGAYMDKERKRAQEMGYLSPIQPDKAATDRDYDAVLLFCLDHLDSVAVCAATHNEKSSKLLADELHKRNIRHDHPHVSFSQLYGMSDQITYNLAKAGYNVAKYLPYGPVKDVIPYLIRRAEENTSVSGQMSRELGLIHKEIKRRGL